MRFKYEKHPSEKSVKLAKVHSERIPILIDYSDKYIYNQPNQLDEVAYSDSNGLVYDDVANVFYIQDGISDDQKILTSRVAANGTPLYYQYQLKFDCIHPENIYIFDKDGTEIKKQIEYAYISDPNLSNRKGPSSKLLDTKEGVYDGLDIYTVLGEFDPSDPALFASINSLKTATRYENIPFNTYGECLANGSVIYTDVAQNYEVMEFYISFSDFPDVSYTIIDGGTWDVTIDNSGDVTGGFGNITLEKYKWYRIRIDFTTSKIRIHNGTFDQEDFIQNLTDATPITLKADNSYIFDVAFFTSATDLVPWTYPLFVARYSKSLFWDAERPAGQTEYRVRLLLPDNEEYFIQYDSIDRDQSVIRNNNEWVSARLVYKKYSNITANDWYYDNVSTIYFVEHADDDLTAIMNVRGLSELIIYVKPSARSRLTPSLRDDKIFVTNGIFRADNWGDIYASETILDYYAIPEYEKMPFASDNQTIVYPKYLKIVRKKAEILSSDIIRINPFYFYEGEYPEYTIPSTIERIYTPNPSGILPSGTLSDVLTDSLDYKNARGINIYIGNELIPNTDIVNYNMTNGLIRLNRTLNIDDVVLVTYLESMEGFSCPYPRIDRHTFEYNSYRIYIRSLYPTYSLEHPDDVQTGERLAYMQLVNGVPTGVMRSCYSNEIILVKVGEYVPFDGTTNPDAHPHADLADITFLERITIEDAREDGGGIKRDIEESYPFSQSYLDIMISNGLQVPQAMTFIKIHTNILDNLISKYEAAGETRKDALNFLKRHIKKHIGLGIFYCIVDENHQLIDDPFPDMSIKGGLS